MLHHYQLFGAVSYRRVDPRNLRIRLTLEAAEGALIADFGEATTRLEKSFTDSGLVDHDMGCDKDWLTKNTRDLRTRGPK